MTDLKERLAAAYWAIQLAVAVVMVAVWLDALNEGRVRRKIVAVLAVGVRRHTPEPSGAEVSAVIRRAEEITKEAMETS